MERFLFNTTNLCLGSQKKETNQKLKMRKNQSFKNTYNSYGSISATAEERKSLLSDSHSSPATSPTSENERFGNFDTARSPTTEHIGTMHGSNYFKEQRRQLEQASSNGLKEKLTWVLQCIEDMLKYIYTSITNVGSQSITSSQEERFREPLAAFKNFVGEKYDSENEVHEQELMQLWKICVPDEALQSRKSQQWKQLGFQGVDPATDFRGVGIFGLRNILYFASTYPTHFQNMLRPTIPHNKASNDFSAYPFMIASFNITMLLFDMMGFATMGTKKKPVSPTAKLNLLKIVFSKKPSSDLINDWEGTSTSSSPSTTFRYIGFEELYVTSFRILDHQWKVMQASYMAFPQVLESTRDRLHVLLETEFTSIEKVCSWNHSGKI